MADDAAILPPPSPEHRRIAAARFDHATQVIAAGHHDYGIQLLLTCCQLAPANLIYRRLLRQTQKAKYQNNLRGGRLAFLTTVPAKARLRAARQAHDYLRMLEIGEEILTRNPWDTGTQLALAEAARKLDLLDLAIWTLEEATRQGPGAPAVNRQLAKLYEECGHLQQSRDLWDLIHQTDPSDGEARAKVQELDANAARAQALAQEVGQWGQNPATSSASPAESNAEDRDAQAGSLRARIERDPTDPKPYLLLARLLRQAGRLEEARAVLARGLGPARSQFELTTELAELDIEPFRQNLRLIEAKLAATPEDEDLHRLRADLRKEINSRELDLYRQKADRFPRDKTLRFELGLRLLRANQVDEALEELEEVRGDLVYHWRAMFYLAHAHLARHHWPLAERYFEEALLHAPPGEEMVRRELLFQLAQGAADAGDLAKAVDVGRGLAELDPEYRDIRRLLEEWQTRQRPPAP